MADTMTPEQRHRCMAAIKGKDTKPEMIVRRYLHALGYRYGLHNRKLPGSPDLVFRKYKTVLFIHGCFWHGHEGCKLYRPPKSNVEFWEQKITRNRARDKKVEEELRRKGWRILTIWECELREKGKREETLHRLRLELERIKRGEADYPELGEIQTAADPEERYGD